MNLLTPPNHVPVSFATVFLIASILHDQTNKAEDAPPDEYFQRYYQPVAVTPRSGPRRLNMQNGDRRRELFSVGVELVPSSAKPLNPFAYDAVRIAFRDVEGAPFSKRPEGVSWSGPDPVYHLHLTLRPPFDTCLSPENVQRCINAGLARAVSPLPEGFKIHFPSFEHDAGARYRQALALGTLRSILLEDNGELTPIPPRFWRSAQAEAVFLSDTPITVDLGDGPTARQATGVVIVDLVALRDGWRAAFSTARTGMLMAEPSYGLYLDFLIEVARSLQMVDGCDANGIRISAATLRERVGELWDSKVPKREELSEHKLTMMVTILRHPGHGAGGALPKETVEAERAERLARAEKAAQARRTG